MCRRERSSDNLDQAQEECIKWVIQRDNKRWEDTDTELTTYKKHIIFYLFFLVNWYLFEITTRGNIFYHQTWPIRLLLCLLCLWVWCFQCNNAYIQLSNIQDPLRATVSIKKYKNSNVIMWCIKPLFLQSNIFYTNLLSWGHCWYEEFGCIYPPRWIFC